MVDIVLPAALRQARTRFNYIDQTGVTRGVYTGAAQTVSYGGDRVGASVEFTPSGGASSIGKSERAQLLAFLMSMRGRQNRVWVANEANDTSQGSFPATELFTNYDFSNDTTGWTASADATLTVSDGVARLAAASATLGPEFYQSVSLPTAYAPYVLRSIVLDGAQSSGLSIGPYLSDSAGGNDDDYSTSRGYRLAMIVAQAAGASNQYPAAIASTTGYTAGAYASCHFASLSRCFLVDGGGNLLLQSNTLGTSWTQTGLSALTSNAIVAPDGTTTAERMVENSGTSTHSINLSQARTSAAADLCAYGYFARDSGTRNVRLYAGNDGSNTGSALFNLSTGVASSISNSGTATNTRAFSVNAGNGYWLCFVVARLPAAATVHVFAEMENNAGSTNYTGNGTSSIAAWRVGATVSSVPTRGTTTTTVAIAAETQTGSSIYVKGLPASTNDLLKIGRWIEIDGQLKMVTAPLNSNAAGLGHLQFSPPLRRAVSDNTPIIVCRPMGRFLLAGENPGWDDSPGIISAASIDLEEAFA